MTTKEAAAYLSGPVGYPLSVKFVRDLKYVREALPLKSEEPGWSTGRPPLTPFCGRTEPTRRTPAFGGTWLIRCACS